MAQKWQVKFYFEDGDTEIPEEEFDDIGEAEDFATEWISDWRVGAEVLNMSNPGDWPETGEEKVRYRIIKSRK